MPYYEGYGEEGNETDCSDCMGSGATSNPTPASEEAGVPAEIVDCPSCGGSGKQN